MTYLHIECVAVLARHPSTKINPLNGSGQTPTDLASSRLINVKGKSQSDPPDFYENSAIQRQSIIDEYDCQLKRLRGFSGPMPSNTAVELRKEWIQYNMPNAIDCKPFSRLHLIDAERGYGRQGRYLSRLFRTQWYEYWKFLDDFIDLNTENACLL
ncbi:unnamed protein product [Trichobilharzia regenti]|nr:unnamed protein product [Trichobilharzia regenti]